MSNNNKSSVSDTATNIARLRAELPSGVKLIAVSKTRPVEEILDAYNEGQRYFGENRVQELLSKKDLVPRDVEWHLIGHLQKNKVKYIVPFINMIQSVDSFRLLTAINTEASKINRVVNCLFQIHIAEEDTKFGFSLEELIDSLENKQSSNLPFVQICGVMGMATYTNDYSLVKREFGYLRNCFELLRSRFFNTGTQFSEISMGMSGDYRLAIEEGSTMLRIGSLIFGDRMK